MLTIYGATRSRASRNIWLALEMGIPYKQVPVVQAYRLANPDAADAPMHTKSPAFLKINPNGHIPSIDDGGLVLHESLAINLYLAKKYAGTKGAHVFGPRDIPEDGLMAMWALWAATEVEPQSIQIMYHRVMKPVEERDPRIADAAVAALRAPFGVLDEALAANGYLVGGRFTVADLNLAEVVRYAVAAPELFDAYPRVKAWLAACQGRDAFKKMWAMRDAEPA